MPKYENVLERDIQLDLLIAMPIGCSLIARTTYGAIDVRGIGGEVHAFTKQGRCRIETSRGGEVVTTNGDIELALGRMLRKADLHVRSVNGRTRLAVPRDFEPKSVHVPKTGA